MADLEELKDIKVEPIEELVNGLKIEFSYDTMNAIYNVG